jgi:hypothetical protein
MDEGDAFPATPHASTISGSEVETLADEASELLSEITRFRNALFDVLNMHYSIYRLPDEEYDYPFILNDRWYTGYMPVALGRGDLTGDNSTASVLDQLLESHGYMVSGECSICLSEDACDAGLLYETLSRVIGKQAVARVSSFLGDRSVALGCGHCFHVGCFGPWVAKRGSNVTCPLCRARVIVSPEGIHI